MRRRRPYVAHPEPVRVDWPSAFKIAFASVIWTGILWLVLLLLFGMITLVASGAR